jgi:transcriptional regulator with XRE-family HTH domain
MTTENRQKTLLTLPQDVLDTFDTLIDTESRNGYIVALRNRKWTLQSIAEATGISRERIRQIATSGEVYPIPPTGSPLPWPPEKAKKAPQVFVEPEPETLARLLELQPLAQKVRSNNTNYRAEAEEYTRLINHAHTVEGVTLYRLAKRLGVTHGALRFRLARYGYKAPAPGSTSKAYVPIKAENRAE